jgi:hypothetical protein
MWKISELHPMLLDCAPLVTLRRAYFWSIADPDFRHSEYWRDQVCLSEWSLARWVVSQTLPPWDTFQTVYERLRLLCMDAGFQEASRIHIKNTVHVPPSFTPCGYDVSRFDWTRERASFLEDKQSMPF